MEYGVSFNCFIETEDRVFSPIGGAEECTSITYIGNNLTRIIEYVIRAESTFGLKHAANHKLIGKRVEDAGKVVAVFVSDDAGDDYVVAVVYTNPDIPTIID